VKKIRMMRPAAMRSEREVSRSRFSRKLGMVMEFYETCV